MALAALAVACDYGDALRSDPAAWDPAHGATKRPDDSNGPPVAACDEVPALDLTLERSTESTRSHAGGQPCLEGCHEAGGQARLAFAAAGTLYRRQGERAAAQAGRSVQGVGGTELSADVCGNVYAVLSVLVSPVQRTQPWVNDPTFRRMEKSLSREARAGDCNRSGCHDFSGRLNSGIYF